MSSYPISAKSRVKFHELHKGKEEDGHIILGRRDIGSYVELPVEAIEVIDLLDSGITVGEAKKLLEEKFGEEVEIEEFIEDMIANEMVKSLDNVEIPTTSQKTKVFLSSITSRHVGWMFSKYAQLLYILIAIFCLIIFVMTPDYVPKVEDYFFHPLYCVAVVFMFLFGWIFIAIHELGHLFAAKSVGIEGTFSLSHRLIFVVAQTHLDNIWTVPREKRFIVYFAGMAWDTVMIFICLISLLVSDSGLIILPNILYNFLKAVIFIKVWAIIWQFRFNMQTDIYYVFGNYFRCVNLLNDAHNLLKNFLSRFIPRIGKVDMNNTPARQMKIIKLYAPFYFIGTFVTIFIFFFRSLPILLFQIVRAFQEIIAGYAANPIAFIDGLVLIAVNTFYYGLLVYFIFKPRWGNLKKKVLSSNHK